MQCIEKRQRIIPSAYLTSVQCKLQVDMQYTMIWRFTLTCSFIHSSLIYYVAIAK